MTNEDALGRTDIMAAIDRYGPNPRAWPVAAPADAVRAAVLADRALRAYLDDAAALDRALAIARDRRDAEVASSGAVDRVTAALTGEVPAPRRRRGRIAVAAALLLAAGIGGVADMGLVDRQGQSVQVVVLDPLVFGPTEIEAP